MLIDVTSCRKVMFININAYTIRIFKKPTKILMAYIIFYETIREKDF